MSVDNSALYKLKQLRSKANDIQKQAKTLIKSCEAGSSETDLLGEVQRLLKRVEGKAAININIPEVDSLRRATAKVDAWHRELQNILDSDSPKTALEEILRQVKQRSHPDDKDPENAPPAPVTPPAVAATSSPAPSTPAETAPSLAGGPSQAGVPARPLHPFSCVCRLPEEEGPSLQCTICHFTYHGKCMGIPLKSVKAYKVRPFHSLTSSVADSDPAPCFVGSATSVRFATPRSETPGRPTASPPSWTFRSRSKPWRRSTSRSQKRGRYEPSAKTPMPSLRRSLVTSGTAARPIISATT